MINKKEFKKAIAEPLRASGFLSRGQTWYLDGQDAIAIINIQKYEYSEMYFINVAFWLKALGYMEFPPAHKCHLDFRVESLFPQHRELLIASCTLTEADEDNVRWLKAFIVDELVPFCRECLQQSQLKIFYKEGRFLEGMVRKEAKTVLSNGSS
ncbi:MAG: hypothetical protein FD156_1937 [Nitrospirae bacterium]|nr:MAG: hypothetical protein FD156_1937 [Nitrospirota bacterium]